MKPTLASAYRLMHDGALALAEVEAAGMQIDVARLDRTVEKVGRRVLSLEEKLKQSGEWKLWRKRFGERTNMRSRSQLAAVLFQEMYHEVGAFTRSGKRIQVNEEQLSKIDSDFARGFLEVEKLKKLHGTYLKGIRREVADGFLHPSFNLHLVKTYRGSCDSPNFQNIPIRDKQIGKLIRSCFVPRDGHVLVEIDYSALEVRIAACYHKDPTMLEYIADPTKDMHRDMAMECFKLSREQVTKEIRFYAKNCFVFPEFYGSYFVQVAPNLWDSCHGLKTGDGITVEEHLAEHGIDGLGSRESNYTTGRIATTGFYEHVREVENDFWGRRFLFYAEWKNRWWKRYQQTGWFPLKTGFRCSGLMKRNDAINYPVQGAAFHCLLWSLIQLVRWMKKSKMRSVIVGQIHDSIVADVHRDELDDYVAEARRVMTEAIRDAWKWIIVPLEIEVEVAETNWFEKKALEA